MTDGASLEERSKADRRHRGEPNALWLPFGPAADPRRARMARPSRNLRTSVHNRLFLYADPGFSIRHHLTRETDR